jgi:hypothetical protein
METGSDAGELAPSAPSPRVRTTYPLEVIQVEIEPERQSQVKGFWQDSWLVRLTIRIRDWVSASLEVKKGARHRR